jgi:hypothetical protein
MSLEADFLLLTFEELTHRDLQPDTDTETTMSLEMQIICGLCEQMGGTLGIEAIATSTPSQVRVLHTLRVDVRDHSRLG